MRYLSYFIATLFACSLAACGGGSASSAASSGNAGSSANTEKSIYKVGDTLSYAYTSSPKYPVNTGVVYSWLNNIQIVAADASGATTRLTTSSLKNIPWYQTVINSNNQEVSEVDNGGGASCTMQPATNDPGVQLAVGQSWSLQYNVSCSSNQGTAITRITNIGSVASLESINTPAGIFNAYKIVYTRDEKLSGEVINPPSYEIVANFTCWRDVVSNILLQCNVDEKEYHGGEFSSETVWSKQLANLNVAKYISMPATPGLYAGTWNISLGGSPSTVCTYVYVDMNGVASSTCFNSAANKVLTLAGSVNGAGQLTASISGVINISGQLNENTSGSGSWATYPGSASGAWTANHV